MMYRVLWEPEKFSLSIGKSKGNHAADLVHQNDVLAPTILGEIIIRSGRDDGPGDIK